MSEHLHSARVANCYRCELSRDEAEDIMRDELEELRAQRQAAMMYATTLAESVNWEGQPVEFERGLGRAMIAALGGPDD